MSILTSADKESMSPHVKDVSHSMDAETLDFVKHHQIITRVSHPHDVCHQIPLLQHPRESQTQ
ncbi:hypothetical protein TSUD_106090 [Trifolium subterraneum]|uniref:Uncharacterized protein n=1 Tax=Trifolium subterraneum TaxID=3900 RepID=A0A2Z6LIK9_TRISU|nr:hypothetical protein TSUD_106090 [Trifolium subterraneum]